VLVDLLCSEGPPLNTDLRFAIVSELAHVPGPTDTYGPHCTLAVVRTYTIHHTTFASAL